MSSQVEPEKAVQAASVLLRAHSGHAMSYLRLLKLLYIADRESLKRTGRPIIGDQFIAVDNGPLHGAVNDLIKGTHPREQVWGDRIAKDRYLVKLVEDPGVLAMSKLEIELLNEIADRHCNESEWELVELTRTFPEWIKNHVSGSSRAIPIVDILEGVGFSAQESADILDDLKEIQLADRLFSSQPALVSP